MMKVGECYYVRTLTDHWVGRVTAVELLSVALTDAAWIADSGRLGQFMKKGKADNMEIEPVGDVTCQWVAYLPWPHKLFMEVI